MILIKITFYGSWLNFVKKQGALYCWGDFNIVRFLSDKNKNGGLHRHYNLFNNVIHENDLIDIFMSGDSYTWSNNKKIQL